jgi:hypothetical protein
VAGNLLPGWTIAMLALALLLPVALAAGSGLLTAAGSPIVAARAAAWAALRAVPFLAAAVLFLLATLVGVMPDPAFPFDPGAESLGLGGTVTAVLAVLAYSSTAFFLRPLRPPPGQAAKTAAPVALLLACIATLGIWAANPYLGLLVAIGLQAWVIAAAGTLGGRLPAAGMVLLGLLPVILLLGDLAARFGAGLGIWQDLLLMLADGQIGSGITLLACLFAGAGVAIVASVWPVPGGLGPERLEPDGEISVRRRIARPKPPQELPAEDQEEGDEPEVEPAPPEPERDPRLWSKPPGSSSRPSGRRRLTPRPSLT